MVFLELCLLAVGLAMDAFAVSVTDGMCMKHFRFRQPAIIALTFGVFQAVMPVIGFWCGMFFYDVIQSVDHWIGFVLLAFLGGKMIYAALQPDPAGESCPAGNGLTAKQLLLQGVATSIDALAVGITLSAVNADILVSALTIGGITALCCFPAVFIGRRFGTILNDKAEILGGCILIGIGIKILVSHLSGM